MYKKIKHFALLTLPISRNAEFSFFMYVLGMVSAACTVFYNWKQELYEASWWEVALWVYAMAAVLTLLPNAIRRMVRGTMYVVAYTVSIADVYCFVKFESPINPSILMLIGETDTREVGEFFSSYLTPDIMASNVSWVLLVLCLHILWTIHRIIRKPYALELCVQRLKKNLCSYRTQLGILISVLLAIAVSLSSKNLHELYNLMTLQTLGDVEHKLTEKDSGKQFLPMYRLVFSIYANSLAAKQIDILREVSHDVRVDSCVYTSPEIVLIIGESYNKYHSQLYGYNRTTTPRQLAMKRCGELVEFTDVVTPWNLTSFVFKHLLSTYAVGDEGEWCNSPLFTQIFRKAGYHVTFLTNEFLPKAKQAVYDFSGGFFLNDPELSASQFNERNKELHVFDEGLLHDYRKIRNIMEQRGDTLHRGYLTIFHLIGQHQDYRIRCPNSKKHFKKEEYDDRQDLTPAWRRNLCNYDNATLYNDSIVERITDLFKDKEAIVIYVPDHGEEVHSRELPHFSGRMHSAQITQRLAREEFEIPFWIWASKTYRKKHGDIWKQVRDAAGLPYMTDALPHTLLHIAGIACPYYRESLDILSPHYDASRKRILKHQTDYDSIMKKSRKFPLSSP